jgi:hypothetical protein
MGLLSSSSRSSSTTNVDEQNNTSVDNRVTDADNAFVGGNVSVAAGDEGGDINISTTDFGALDTASQIADSAFSFSSQASSDLTSGLNTAVSAVKGIADNATKDEAARTQQFLILGAVVIAGVYAFVFVKKGRK